MLYDIISYRIWASHDPYDGGEKKSLSTYIYSISSEVRNYLHNIIYYYYYYYHYIILMYIIYIYIDEEIKITARRVLYKKGRTTAAAYIRSDKWWMMILYSYIFIIDMDTSLLYTEILLSSYIRVLSVQPIFISPCNTKTPSKSSSKPFHCGHNGE